MVVVLPAAEKVEPPPYARVDPTTSTPSSSRGPPVPPRTSSEPPTPNNAKNYLRVARVNEDISGRWVINPTLGSTIAPPQAEGPNVIFQVLQKGKIDVIVAWEADSDDDSSSRQLPRAKVEATSDKGDVIITNTTRPKGLPLHIKCTSNKKGDVKICTPPDFRGVLALRIPASSSDWRSRIGLAAQIQENVSATRETVCRIKNKDKQKAHPNASVDPGPSEEQILMEFLVGNDLELPDFNRTGEAGEGALDLIEVEVNDGRIMILAPEDAALRDEPFPELAHVRPCESTKPGKSWKLSGLTGPGSGVTVSTAGNTDANGITIVINEPRWFGSVMKKFGKLGGGHGESKPKMYPAQDEFVGPKSNRMHTLSPHSSTSTLVSTTDLPLQRNSLSSPAASPQQSPLSSGRIDRPVASQIVPKFADDYEDLVPGDLIQPPPRRDHRSSSTSNIPRPSIAPQRSPQPSSRRTPSNSGPQMYSQSPSRPGTSCRPLRPPPHSTPNTDGCSLGRHRPPILQTLSLSDEDLPHRNSQHYPPLPHRNTFPNPRPQNSTLPSERRHSHLTPQAAMFDPRGPYAGPYHTDPLSPHRQLSPDSPSSSSVHSNSGVTRRLQKLQKVKPHRIKSTPDLREQAERRSHEREPVHVPFLTRGERRFIQ